MFVHHLNPVLVELGPLQIRYYGLMYVIGIVIGYYLLLYLVRKREMRLTGQEVGDFLFAAVVGGIIGARVVYCLVYNPWYYLSRPVEMLFIWQGGLSFHGGILGGFLGSYLFCLKKKLDFLTIADLVVIPFALALSLGRVGNFINGELPGRITEVPWCFQFPGAEGCRHPSQLYASLKDLLLFGVLWVLKDRNLKKGMLFSMFLVFYAILRFSVEFFREADPQLGYFSGLSMGQLLSMIMFSVGIAVLYRTQKKK